MITVNNLYKNYGKFPALKGISFEVNNGEIVGFVGLNGAGKSTTIKISAGVILPTKGDVEIDGYSVTKDKKKAVRNVGWVPELPIFEPNVKALDYFVYLSGYYGISTSEARSIGKKLFAELGLSGWENTKLDNFSQGMKKRFALAVSLVSNPNNFLFDEVLNGLDPQGIQFFKELALRLKKDGRAILFSSHILSEVENLADKVVFIHKGKIIGIKKIEDLRKLVTRKVIKVVVNDPNSALKVCEKYGKPTLINGEIFINDFEGDIPSLAVDLKPYGVVEIGYLRENLENVFFQLISEYEKTYQ
ncbi:ABC transporter ATP-binding protein [Sulfurisphaera javensis]|uniref:ABC transporter ATP-binding protein n=1 Tax=Sulfurisphaera javensis TaxID=2049879 RepID=A0AAT9GMP7_9CREN